MKKYYVMYACPNADTFWEVETDSIERYEKMTNNLSYNQTMQIYDQKRDRILFEKSVATDVPQINILNEYMRDLRTKTGYKKEGKR